MRIFTGNSGTVTTTANLNCLGISTMEHRTMNTSLRLGTLAAALAFLAAASFAERGDDTDRRSKNGRTAGSIDGIEIVLEYGRPEVRGREIWGALVPYGHVWRTGADEATTFELLGDLRIEGRTLAAGRYGLFTIPGPEQWTVIFNKTADQWGAFDYDPAQDALRVTVVPRVIAEPVEALRFDLTDTSVELRWDRLVVPLTITRP